MRIIFFLFLTVFIDEVASAQEHSSFELDYYSIGLGSSEGDLNKYLHIERNTLYYTSQVEKSFVAEKVDERTKDTVWMQGSASVKLRSSTIDTIINLLSNLPNDTLTRANYCVKSGAIYVMKSTSPKWGVSYIRMINTFDSTAYKILELLNSYIPKDDRKYYPQRLWELSDGCMESILKRANYRNEILSIHSSDSLLSIQQIPYKENDTKISLAEKIEIKYGDTLITFIDEFDRSNKECDSLTSPFTSLCSYYNLPIFMRCLKLDSNIYALLGSYVNHPVQIKHIWIVDITNESPIKKFAMLSSRTLSAQIQFTYSPLEKMIFINSIDNEVLDRNCMLVGEGEISNTEIEFIPIEEVNYKYWLQKSETKHLESKKGYMFGLKLR